MEEKEFKPYEDLPGLYDVIGDNIRKAHPEFDFTKFGDSFIFEVGLFMPKQSILTLFKTDKNHMDWMCKKTFDNYNFDDAYAYYREMAMSKCKNMFMDFAQGGATYPQQIVAKFFMGFNDSADSGDKTVKIKVVGAVPEEDN